MRPRSIMTACSLAALLLLAAACSGDGDPPGQDGGITLPDGSACTPSNCVGCCTTTGACIIVPSNTYCGSGGKACIPCKNTEICSQGQCIPAGKCSQASCPGGCCKGDTCMPGTGKEACGSSGIQCLQCSTTQKCGTNKSCVCDSSSCSGCCDAATQTCKSGNSSMACGKGGNACKMCDAGQVCKEGGCTKGEKCSSSNCSTGCCDGDTCMKGDTPSFCGTGGASCKTCQTGFKCQSGVCNDPSKCGPSSCASGCCSQGQCLSGSSINACGTGGNVCQACKKSQLCTSGKCKLDPSSKWSITVVNADLDKSKSWDTLINTEPDVYVQVGVGSNTGKTTVKNNTYAPYWNELVLTTTAGSLASYGLSLKVYDDDWPTGDQLMGSCKPSVPEKVLLSGAGYMQSCGGKDVKKINFTFTAN